MRTPRSQPSSLCEEVAPCYFAFCEIAVTARRAVSPAASEAPSEPKDRADRCTTSLSFQIAQSNRPGSVADGVTRREWGLGVKMIMGIIWARAHVFPNDAAASVHPRD